MRNIFNVSCVTTLAITNVINICVIYICHVLQVS